MERQMHINNDHNFFDKIFIPINPNLKICILGDTVTPEKAACQIKEALIAKGYLNVYGVDKEFLTLASINQQIDLLILCMHPAKSIHLLTDNYKLFKNVIIQPGAESNEILNELKVHNINFTCGCVLKYFGLK